MQRPADDSRLQAPRRKTSFGQGPKPSPDARTLQWSSEAHAPLPCTPPLLSPAWARTCATWFNAHAPRQTGWHLLLQCRKLGIERAVGGVEYVVVGQREPLEPLHTRSVAITRSHCGNMPCRVEHAGRRAVHRRCRCAGVCDMLLHVAVQL
jgi:hypothetical protein